MKFLLGLAMSLAGVAGWAQAPAAPPPVQIVVTALANRGETPIPPREVAVEVGNKPATVAGWQPLGRLDLAIVIDEDTVHLGTGLDDLKTFVGGLPAPTAVAIVYMHTGVVTIAQALTSDHARAAQALHMPAGTPNISPSPFGSLADLLARWPRHPDRPRELLLISDGQEHVGGNTGSNATLEKALRIAVQSGVVAFTIYAAGAGGDQDAVAERGTPLGAAGAAFSAFSSPNLDTNQGISNLGELSAVTGGESYSAGTSGNARLTSFLDDIARRLRSQYLLTLASAAGHGHGELAFKLKIQTSGLKVTAPQHVYVP